VRDVEGLRKLYAGTHRRLVVQLAAITGDLAEAEDVVQEAFSRALSRWPRIRDYDNPEAWVYAVALNLARSRWRRTRTALIALPKLRARSIEPELSPDHVALLAALRQLPERQREAVVLHHIGDLSVDEVARRMNVPVGTVKSWLSRSRVALAAHLGVDEEVPLNG
jgi:RNA polymerase sigma-70 factor (ECF subfamily)